MTDLLVGLEEEMERNAKKEQHATCHKFDFHSDCCTRVLLVQKVLGNGVEIHTTT